MYMSAEVVAINMEELKEENMKLFSVVKKVREQSNTIAYSQDYTVSYSQGYCVGFFCGG